jgi:hypothetical protein
MVFQIVSGCYNRLVVAVVVVVLLLDTVPLCTHARLEHSLRGLAQAGKESASSAVGSISAPKATRTPRVRSTKVDDNTGVGGQGKGESSVYSMLQDPPAELNHQLNSRNNGQLIPA